jgi:site-specific recombinase XerD
VAFPPLDGTLSYVVTRNATQSRGPIPEFLAQKQAEQAEKTYRQYKESLGQLWDFFEVEGLTSVGDFTLHAVNRFRTHLKQRALAENTIINRLRAIRTFGKWMADRGWTDGDVLAGLKIPQATKPHFDLIPDDARARLFGLYDPDTFLGSRTLAMLAVLSDTGLRREEVVHLAAKNVDLTGHVIRVFSDKRTEWRWVPLTDEAVAYIRNYQKWRERYFKGTARTRTYQGDDVHRTRKPRTVDPDALFVAWNGKPLDPQELDHLLQRASKKLGFHVHPHLFRHDWITRKALDGENPSVVRRWAGHKTFAMTDYYFGLADEMLGAIKPKRSVLSSVPLPSTSRRGRPPKPAAK